MTAPSATATAPAEVSWSCQPVSLDRRPADQPHLDVGVPVERDEVAALV